MAVAARAATADARTMNGKLIGAFCGGAFIGQLAARALFDWILDVGGTLEIVLVVGSALLLAVVFLTAQIETERKQAG
jgi:hypothetical protein